MKKEDYELLIIAAGSYELLCPTGGLTAAIELAGARLRQFDGVSRLDRLMQNAFMRTGQISAALEVLQIILKEDGPLTEAVVAEFSKDVAGFIQFIGNRAKVKEDLIELAAEYVRSGAL